MHRGSRARLRPLRLLSPVSNQKASSSQSAPTPVHVRAAVLVDRGQPGRVAVRPPCPGAMVTPSPGGRRWVPSPAPRGRRDQPGSWSAWSFETPCPRKSSVAARPATPTYGGGHRGARVGLGVCPTPVDRAAMVHGGTSSRSCTGGTDPRTSNGCCRTGSRSRRWTDRAWVGLVPFFLRVGLPHVPSIPWFSRFAETNVRTYVRSADGETGIWFFSLDAARLGAVVVARSTYRLPYFWSKMRLERTGSTIRYDCRRRWPGPKGARARVEVEIGEPFAPDELTAARPLPHRPVGALQRTPLGPAPRQGLPRPLAAPPGGGHPARRRTGRPPRACLSQSGAAGALVTVGRGPDRLAGGPRRGEPALTTRLAVPVPPLAGSAAHPGPSAVVRVGACPLPTSNRSPGPPPSTTSP